MAILALSEKGKQPMTKKHFIALADAIREHDKTHDAAGTHDMFRQSQLEMLANFCARQNPRFNREKWLDYIDNGEKQKPLTQREVKEAYEADLAEGKL
jgi:hypothetical protein